MDVFPDEKNQFIKALNELKIGTKFKINEETLEQKELARQLKQEENISNGEKLLQEIKNLTVPKSIFHVHDFLEEKSGKGNIKPLERKVNAFENKFETEEWAADLVDQMRNEIVKKRNAANKVK